MRVRLISLFLVAAVCGTVARVQAAPGDDFFRLTEVHQIHLTVSAEDYAAMDPPPPASGPFGFGGRSQNQPERPNFGDPNFGAGSFGFEFEYVEADVEIEDDKFPKVGLRYKGNGTYLVSQSQAKRSFKIDFDRFDAEKTLDGLTKINLHSGVMDPTKARDALAYSVFRAAGVPAPRTTFAEVTLTVPGKYDREYLGLYVAVEQVDSRFLQAHFGDNNGLLLKPEGIRGLPYFGDDPELYQPTYNPKSKSGRGDWNRLVEFTHLVNEADDEQFHAEIEKYLDVDGFTRFLATNTVLASLDGFIGLGHNFYLYQDPATDRFVFVPWDLDLAFGAFAIYGSPEQLADLSIDHPHLAPNKLIDRLLAMPKVRDAYREQVRYLATEVLTSDTFENHLAAIEQLTARTDELEKAAASDRNESGGSGMFGGMFQGLPLRTFIEKRVASVTAQLAGEPGGHVPQMMSFGSPGGFGSRTSRTAPWFEALDADQDGQITEEEFMSGMKQFFVEWDTDNDGTLSQQEIAEGLRKLMPTPAPFGQPRRQ